MQSSTCQEQVGEALRISIWPAPSVLLPALSRYLAVGDIVARVLPACPRALAGACAGFIPPPEPREGWAYGKICS